jgi:hypothetical protein
MADMQILLLEQHSETREEFVTEIERKAGVEVIPVEYPHDALRVLKSTQINIVLITRERTDAEVELVLKEAAAVSARSNKPLVALVLIQGEEFPSSLAKFEALGAEWLWREFPSLVIQKLKAKRWELAPSKVFPAIKIEMEGLDPILITLIGVKCAVPVELGPSLCEFVYFLAKHPYSSSQSIAGGLGISRQSVKTYRLRLVRAVDKIRAKAGVNKSGERIFRCEKRNGGWIYWIEAWVLG